MSYKRNKNKRFNQRLIMIIHNYPELDMRTITSWNRKNRELQKLHK